MEPDEEVVSDVHLFLTEHDRTQLVPDQYFGNYPVYLSRFLFRNSTSEEDEKEARAFQKLDEEVNEGHQMDNDGDLILCRRHKICSEVMYLEHAMKTRLQDVGLQVWPGCMILCDFVIDNRKTFDNKVVVELGAGIGLASIVASMFSRRVIATDVNTDVLKACARNATLNEQLSNSTSLSSCLDSPSYSFRKVETCHLDWFSLDGGDEDKDGYHTDSASEMLIHSIDESGSSYLLNLNEIDILIASDVVYSDQITDAFFRIVYKILRNSSRCKRLIMSVEKRLNFTLEDLDVAAPAYEHFCDCLVFLSEQNENAEEKFTVERVKNIPQYFEYQRSQYLEVWKISLQKCNPT